MVLRQVLEIPGPTLDLSMPLRCLVAVVDSVRTDVREEHSTGGDHAGKLAQCLLVLLEVVEQQDRVSAAEGRTRELAKVSDVHARPVPGAVVAVQRDGLERNPVVDQLALAVRGRESEYRGASDERLVDRGPDDLFHHRPQAARSSGLVATRAVLSARRGLDGIAADRARGNPQPSTRDRPQTPARDQ